MTTGDLYLELSTNINRPSKTRRLWCGGISRLEGERAFQWHGVCFSRMSADAVNWEWLGLSASRFPELGAHIIVVCNPERLCSFISMKRSEKRDLRLRLPQATHSRLNFPFQGNLPAAVVTSSLWLRWYVEVTCVVLFLLLFHDWLTEINYSVRTVMEARWRIVISAEAPAILPNALMSLSI